ncbi:MAG: helix-turn-helix domain-containing protein [Bryobacteraceae bacterium]
MQSETSPKSDDARRPFRLKARAGEIDVLIGQRIRARRDELRLTQQKLAKAVGVAFQQIQKYEGGINRVSASTLIRIAQALGIDIRYFYQGLQAPASSIPPIPEPKPRDLVALFQRIGNPKHRWQVFELAGTIAELSSDEK